jgi:hypothetical protein
MRKALEEFFSEKDWDTKVSSVSHLFALLAKDAEAARPGDEQTKADAAIVATLFDHSRAAVGLSQRCRRQTVDASYDVGLVQSLILLSDESAWRFPDYHDVDFSKWTTSQQVAVCPDFGRYADFYYLVNMENGEVVVAKRAW